jgi:hypothetical protein
MKNLSITKRMGRPPIKNPASDFLHLRVTPEQKAIYQKLAPPLTMSKWVLRELDRAAKKIM